LKVFFGILALLGFALSAAAHAYGLIGGSLHDNFAFVSTLHAGIFLVFIPAILEVRKTSGKRDAFALLRGVPFGAIVLLAVLFVYAFLNFSSSFAGMPEGSPQLRDGQYVLMNKGHFIRTITAEEYVQGQAAILRAFSGGWMLLYGLCAVILLLRRRPSRS
jgi:hypothetical protein